MPAVLVAIPAHNEAKHIRQCLTSVAVAADHAVSSGRVEHVVVELVAHRCIDATAAVARTIVGRSINGGVTELGTLGGVGLVRDFAIRIGLRRLGRPPAETWILSTDADTVVATDWVSRGIAEAQAARAVAVVGLATLDVPLSTALGRQAYNDLFASKMTRDEKGLPAHAHVYGANLAVRADAYLTVGGFRHHSNGEDQRLVDALADAGQQVVRTRTWSVVTSSRTTGRAIGGLADLLMGLEAEASGKRLKMETDVSDLAGVIAG